MRTVRLITGDAVTLTSPPPGQSQVAMVPTTHRKAASLVTLTADGQNYAIPASALPYLGRGLDPSLFDVAALLTAESAGRLPVRIDYQGRRPVLPGVTIISADHGTAQGYLTASSADDFGAALARQFAADHISGRYGTDGMFGHGVSVSLPGFKPAAAPPGAGVAPARPGNAMKTLTFAGTNRAGKPDTGDMVIIANTDNSRLLSGGYSTATFYHGTARFSVPVGHYFAVGFFFGTSTTGAPFPVTHELDVLPQFTVAGNTTVRVAARAANSKISMVTPRPAAVQNTLFEIVRTPRSGPAESFGFNNYRWLGGDSPIWVSPTSGRPTAGTMATVTSQWLAGPAGVTPYEYDLAYQNLSGIIPPQRYLVRRASLAAIEVHYYLDAGGGFLSRVSSFPLQRGSLAFPYDPVNAPGTRIIYTSAGPDLIWTTSLYTASHGNPGTLIQSDPARVYRVGEQVTENWDAYPLHPAANVDMIGSRGLWGHYVTVPSASRSGDTLTLDFTPFSDNTPGHTGDGFSTDFGTRKVSGTYQIDQNGTKIAAGNAVTAAGGQPGLLVQTALRPGRAAIRFTLTASLDDARGQLSTRSRTTWAWTSVHESGGTLPAGWQCGSGGRHCRVEPLLMLGYSVPGMSQDGSAPPGRQILCLAVQHLPLAQVAAVTGLAVQASFDGGHTWHATRVVGGGGRFRAVFSAPAGSSVTLRTHATDAAGGSVTETITRAYLIAP